MTAAEAYKHYKVSPAEQLMVHQKQDGLDGGPLYKVVSKRAHKYHVTAGWEIVAPPKPAPKEAEITASSAAEKLAKEHGIDLSTVKGSGANGNITKGDIEALIGE